MKLELIIGQPTLLLIAVLIAAAIVVICGRKLRLSRTEQKNVKWRVEAGAETKSQGES